MNNNGGSFEANAQPVLEAQALQPENPSRWERMQDWFHDRKETIQRVAATAALAGGLAGGAYVISQHETPDFKEVNITEIGRNAIDAGEAIAPFIIGLAAADVASMSLSLTGRKNLRLAWEGISPNSGNYYKTLVAGSLLPIIGITALSNALLIEDGLRSGPSQNIETMARGIRTSAGPLGEGAKVVWGLQPGTKHFMNESSISTDAIEKIEAAVAANQSGDVKVIEPFDIKLTTIPTEHNDRQAGLIIYSDGVAGMPSAISPEVKLGATCDVIDAKCLLKPGELVVDDNEGLSIGDTVKIQGHDFNVVGFSKESQSLINRLVAYTALPEKKPENYFGFAAMANSQQDVEQMIHDLRLTDKINVESTAELIEFNKEFWSQNGTPLIMLMVGDILIFAGATFISTRRYEQERNKSLIAGMEAIGMSKRQFAQQQRARATILTAKGVLPAAVAAAASEQFINSVLTGFHSELTPSMLAVSTATILAVQLGAPLTSKLPFGKKETIAHKMKQD